MRVIHRYPDEPSEQARRQALLDTHRKCILLLRSRQPPARANAEFRGR